MVNNIESNLKRLKKGDVCFDNSHETFFIRYIFILSLVSLLFLLSNATYAKAPIEVTLKQSAQEVWQREQLLITLNVITDDPFSRLDIEDFIKKGFSIIPFKQQRIEQKNKSQLTMQWAVFPFITGKHQLELPRIRYRPNSGRIQTLDLTTLSLTVKKLPLYVPPTMPVGKIILQQNWEDGSVISINHLLEWKITVIGEGVAKQMMPPISRQIVSTKGLQILPIQSTQNTNKSEKGIKNIRHYKIPLKAKQIGRLELPNIDIQYFEPNSAKLKTASLSPPFVISLSKWLMGLIIFLILFIVILFLKFLRQKLKLLLKQHIEKKLALQALEQATNYTQIRHALSHLAKTDGFENNGSLTLFVKNWEEKHGKSVELRTAITKLQRAEFSRNEKKYNEEDLNEDIKENLALLRKAIHKAKL